MARCAYCQTETELHAGGVPVCIQCAEGSPEKRQVRATLFGELIEATKRAESASDAFAAVVKDIPSGIPHPDGVQRIQNASRELAAARDGIVKAHNRLNGFLEHGILPEDLKQS